MNDCVFNCEQVGEPTLQVEMLVDDKGEFQSGFGTHAHKRVAGVAHVECYKAWYEQTYKSPFTMSD